MGVGGFGDLFRPGVVAVGSMLMLPCPVVGEAVSKKKTKKK
jgi:hypothetical protein